MMMIERYEPLAPQPLAVGKHRIVVDTDIARPAAPAAITITLDGSDMMRLDVKRTVPGAFSASETLDVGTDLGSPVSLAYSDRRPFAFNGRIGSMMVDLK